MLGLKGLGTWDEITSCTQSSTCLDPKPAPLGLGSLLDPNHAPCGLGSLAGLVRSPILKAKPSSTAKFRNTEQGSYFILDTQGRKVLEGET
jgi:hypothetical protein